MDEELFIYHSAPVEKIPMILKEGLTGGEETYRREMEEGLEATASQKNISLPVKRQESGSVEIYSSDILLPETASR